MRVIPRFSPARTLERTVGAINAIRTSRPALARSALMLTALASPALLGCLPLGPTLSMVPAAVDRSCTFDVTGALNNWLISVPNGWTAGFQGGGCYRIDGTLVVTNKANFMIDGDGATFRPGSVTGDASSIESPSKAAHSRSQWRLVGGSHVTIQNMTIEGADPSGTYNTKFETQHGIDIRGTEAVDINHVTIRNVFGDFVAFSQSPTSQSSGRIHDSTLSNAGRMGVSVTAAHHVSIDHNNISGVTYGLVDLEPEGTLHGASIISVDCNHFGPGGGYMVGAISTYGAVSNVSVTGNSLTPNIMMTWKFPYGAPNPWVNFSGNYYA